jgi:hypothetical protein
LPLLLEKGKGEVLPPPITCDPESGAICLMLFTTHERMEKFLLQFFEKSVIFRIAIKDSHEKRNYKPISRDQSDKQ